MPGLGPLLRAAGRRIEGSPDSAGSIRGFIAVGSAAAGLIHAAVVSEHLSESLLFAAFFAALAVWQVKWAFQVVTRPSRSLLTRGALVNGGVVAIWILSRTIGFPVGPQHWTPEALGLRDLLSSLLEAAIVLGALLLADLGEGPQGTPRAVVARSAMRTGSVLAPLTALVLIAGSLAGPAESAVHQTTAVHGGHGPLEIYAILAASCLFALYALLDAWANGLPRFTWRLDGGRSA